MSLIAKLDEMRSFGGAVRTAGLPDALIQRLAAQYPEIGEAVDEAHELFVQLQAEFPELLKLDENAQLARVQADFVNFYSEDAVNPYVALAGRGPWVVTLKGAVVHDSGGYGMLGFGHAPKAVIAAMARAASRWSEASSAPCSSRACRPRAHHRAACTADRRASRTGRAD